MKLTITTINYDDQNGPKEPITPTSKGGYEVMYDRPTLNGGYETVCVYQEHHIQAALDGNNPHNIPRRLLELGKAAIAAAETEYALKKNVALVTTALAAGVEAGSEVIMRGERKLFRRAQDMIVGVFTFPFRRKSLTRKIPKALKFD